MERDLGAVHPDWTGIRADVVDVRGTAVHVLRAGRPGAKPPHLLVHGLGGTSANWLEVMRDLAAFGEVVAPDLPGFGRTEPPVASASRVRANARFLPALMDALGWETAVVHGNSMGGMIATLAAARSPERFGAVVLVSPALPVARAEMLSLERIALNRFAPFTVPGLGRAMLRRQWSRLTPEGLWAEAAPFNFHRPERVRPDLRRILIDNIALGRRLPWRFEGLAVATESLVATLIGGRELQGAMDDVAAPTLFVWGEQDRLVGRAVVDNAHTRRDDWTIAPLPGIGHAPQMETPDVYLDTVKGWFGDLGLVGALA